MATNGQTIAEPARETPVRHDVDVLVVGAGSSGLAAAATAAREGARVLLVDRYGFLGGTLSMVTLGSICGLYTVTPDTVKPVVAGFADELIDRLRRADGAKDHVRWLETASLPYDPPTLRMVADDVARESHVRLALHSQAVAVERDGGRIGGVIFESRDGRWACRAKTVVDCTGDANIAMMAGVPFDHVPEENQAPTAMFKFGGVDTERAMALSRDDLRGHLERAVESGLDLPRTAGGMFSLRPGEVHLNITRVTRDGRAPDSLNTEQMTDAEVEGRRQLRLYQRAFRDFVPGYENCYVADMGAELGIRESRRVHGAYMLQVDDVLKEGRFDDAIACSAWPVEEHGAGRATRWVFLEPGTYYQLPYRMMVPQAVDGLLVAGRCASATHDAHASMRVAATCMAMGEAAGVAAARSADTGVTPGALDTADIQRRLLARGAWLGAGFAVGETGATRQAGAAE